MFQVGRGDERKFVFKHALIQDAAYGSLLSTRRRDLHGQIVSDLIKNRPDTVTQQPEVIARHFSAAGDRKAAADHWRLAGQKAALISAEKDAEICYHSGLAELEKCASSHYTNILAFDLRIALASVYFYTEGPSSDNAEQAYLRARDLSDRIEDSERQNSVRWGLWALYWNRGDTGAGAPYAYEQLGQLREGSHPFAVSVAHRSVAVTEMTLGRFRPAVEHAEIACGAIGPNDDGKTATRFGHDLNVAAHLMLALAKGALGDVSTATSIARKCLKSAQHHRHAPTFSYAVYFGGLVQMLCRERIIDDDIVAMINTRTGSIPLVSENWGDLAGGFDVMNGDYESGLKKMSDWHERAESNDRQFGAIYVELVFRTVFADALLAVGRLNDAKDVVRDAVRISESTGFRWWSAESLRVEAGIHCAIGDSPTAVQIYTKALDVAKEQSARLFQLRISVDLAKLHIRDDSANLAGELLKAALSDTSACDLCRDIFEAKTLLQGI